MLYEPITVSFCVVTKDRVRETLQCIRKLIELSLNAPKHIYPEIVVLCNGTSPELLMQFKDGIIAEFLSVVSVSYKIIESTSNTGVAGGRNILFKQSTGEIVVFIDDDAVIETSSGLFWEKLTEFYFDSNMGILAFKSLAPNGTVTAKEIPVPLKESDKITETVSFVGVAHVIKRSIVQRDVLYPPKLFYGMEEWYFSLWVVNLGKKIVYDPQLVVRHYKSQVNRLEKDQYYINLARNKVYISFLAMPWFSKLSYYVLWSLWLLKRTHLSLKSIRKFNNELWELWRSQETTNFRMRLSTRCIFYILKLKPQALFF